MKLGYLGTMRTFNRLKGYRYFQFENARLKKRFSQFLESVEIDKLVSRLPFGHEPGSMQGSSVTLRHIFPRKLRLERDLLLVLLDCAAGFLKVNRIRSYTYEELYVSMKDKQDEVDSTLRSEFTEGGASIEVSKGVESTLRNPIRRKQFDKPAYYYSTLMDYLSRESGNSS